MTPVHPIHSTPSEAIDSYPGMELIHAITERTSSVTLFSDVAGQALEMIEAPQTTVAAFTRLIQQDTQLATHVLAIANSPIYSSSHSTTDLDGAVSRAGLDQARSLVVASSIAAWVNSLDLQDGRIQTAIWKHSVLTGTIAANLSHTLQLGFEGEAFTAGLVHDLGRLLIAATFPESFSQLDPLDFDESSDVLAHEDKILGSNHCDLGCWFAAEQGLPHEWCDVIRHHHSPRQSNLHERLVALTATADHMANHYQRFMEPQDYHAADNPGIQILAQCQLPDVVTQFNDVAREVLATSVQDGTTLASL